MSETVAKPVFQPNREFAKTARIKNMCEYRELAQWAEEDYEGFWDHFAKEKIDWFEPYSNVLDDSNMPFVVTYLELYYNVNKMANLLKNEFGIGKGDRVVIYMPMILEAAYAMLACTRIGAIHSIVFGGFSAEALRDRIIDAEAKLVIPADGAYRKGKPYMLKPVVDKALEEGCECVEKVLVVERNGEEIESAHPSRWILKIRCFCFIPPVRPASPKAFSITPPAISSGRR